MNCQGPPEIHMRINAFFVKSIKECKISVPALALALTLALKPFTEISFHFILQGTFPFEIELKEKFLMFSSFKESIYSYCISDDTGTSTGTSTGTGLALALALKSSNFCFLKEIHKFSLDFD